MKSNIRPVSLVIFGALLLAYLPLAATQIAGDPGGSLTTPSSSAIQEALPSTVMTQATVGEVSTAEQTVTLNGIKLGFASQPPQIHGEYGKGLMNIGDLRTGMVVRVQVSSDQNNRKIHGLWVVR